ncbi:hypothetical protein PV326_008680 [Microctonus aethiopoides]|nr:hypothetical protein PV326_008680 [Microctonus aethiopoides]
MKVIIGSIDTLTLIKKKFPEREGKGALKLTLLVKDLLSEPCDNAHDAFKDSICDLKNSLSSKENERSLKPLQNVVSNYTIKKLANAGISILELQEKYKVNAEQPSSHRRGECSMLLAALGRVCLKLVIVMGVTWIADVISWVVGGPKYLWYFTDLLNALQGLFIFIVVGWQPQIRANLKRIFMKNPHSNTRRVVNGLSTTSHGMPSIGDSMTQNPTTKITPMETIC